MAQVINEPLELKKDFLPSVTFAETHVDTVVTTLVSPANPGDPRNGIDPTPAMYHYSVAASRAATATLIANVKGIVLANIDETTAFSMTLGKTAVAFTLGDIPTYVKGHTTTFYCWKGWNAAKKALGTGGVKLTWTATKLTVVVTMGNEETRPSPISSDDFVGAGTDPGTFPIKDTVAAEITFGSIATTVPRTVYLSGSNKITHVHKGTIDAPLYDFDLYTVSETGAADYVRPLVVLTSPKQGASVGAAVDVKGTAYDAKGLVGVEWTKDPNSAWTTTDQFSYSAQPADGLWGAASAIWTISLQSLPRGTTRLWVRSIDESGNTSLPMLVTLVNPMPTLLTGRWDSLLAPEAVNGLPGAMHFTFAVNGSFTGTLVQEGGSFPFSGSLLPDETLSFSIKRGTVFPALTFTGAIGSFSPVGEAAASITGSLSLTGNNLATFTATRSPWSAAKLASIALAGRFHVKIAAATAPIGDNYTVVTTARSGTATAAFAMADGSVVTWSGVMGANGQLPAFGLLYGGKGSVSSPMTVNGADRTINATTAIWVRPSSFTDKQFPAGFQYNGLTASGQAYAAPVPATVRVMSLLGASPNATVSWSGDGVNPALSLGFTVKTSNLLSVPTTTDALHLGLTASTGLWTGSFKIPGTAVLSTCKMLIVGNEAYGHWTAPAPTGSVVKRFGVIHVQ
ncbi:MAG: hypothetical protein JWO89_101 [Verrucomicrobiaceae bacterium]|nr:hypothetical protein [Verrucomicrobiaceae bacterium]